MLAIASGHGQFGGGDKNQRNMHRIQVVDKDMKAWTMSSEQTCLPTRTGRLEGAGEEWASGWGRTVDLYPGCLTEPAWLLTYCMSIHSKIFDIPNKYTELFQPANYTTILQRF